MDGSCKAYGESLLHSKKQVEHERLRLAKTVGRLTNSYKGTYKRRQTHRFCSCIDGPLTLTLFHYMRTRPVVNNCIPTPFLAFQPWHSYLPDPSLGMGVCVSACAYISRVRLYFRKGSGHQTMCILPVAFGSEISTADESESRDLLWWALIRTYPTRCGPMRVSLQSNWSCPTWTPVGSE